MVQPLTPPTAAPPGAVGHWFVPHPTVAPPRDPPRWWTVAAEPETEHKRIVFEVLAMLLFIAAPSFLIGLDGINDPTSISTDDISILELLASIAGSAGAALMATHLLWRDRKLAAAGFNKRSPLFALGYGALGFVACYGAIIAVGIVIVAFLALFGSSDPTGGESPDVSFTWASMIAAYLIAITAGITEEIIFRGYAITRLEQLGWKRAAYVVPAVVFTSLHLYQGVLAVLVIGAVAAVLTWLYKWKRSLLPVMVAHALFDAFQLTLAALLS
jgi:membrane protease YdiL (CAAX protease family)